MPYEHYRRLCIAQIWRRAHFCQQRLAEMMDVQAAVFAFDPVRIISETVHSHALESRIFGKPFLRPIVCDRACLAPRLPGTAAEAVHEYEVDKRLGGRV